MTDRPPSLATPISIIVAGFMIASAIYVSNTQGQVAGIDTVNGTAAAPSLAAQGDAAPTAPTAPSGTPTAAAAPTGGLITVSVDDDPVLGDPNAPVTIVEFSDFRCPFCARFFTEALTQLKEEYIDTGKAKLVYRDLSIHPPGSDDASAGAHCAGDQGKFWEYHDLLFAKFQEGDRFTPEDIKSYAGELGLNQATFDSCFDEGKYVDEVNKDGADARAATATGTPTLFIGKTTESGEIEATKIVGAQPFATFAAEIDRLLAE